MAKILVIDDDQDILDFIRTGLEDTHDVTTAINGEEGLYACDDAVFDVILTDIFMPYRDGLDIVREVAMSYPASKTIAMTGHTGEGQSNYLKAAEALGAFRALQKPFTIEELLKVVEETLNA